MSNKHNNSGFVGGDDRLKKSDGATVRSDRDSADTLRTDTDGTAFTAEERKKFFRNEWKQEVLPTPGDIPGYHLCWLSTNSKGDPIHNRMRIGYEPVKASELRGFEKYTMRGGEWDGFVSCNEMLLFKLPMEIYQEMMEEFHYNMPLEQEQSIRQQLEMEAEQRDSNGKRLGAIEGDGFQNMGRGQRRPSFT